MFVRSFSLISRIINDARFGLVFPLLSFLLLSLISGDISWPSRTPSHHLQRLGKLAVCLLAIAYAKRKRKLQKPAAAQSQNSGHIGHSYVTFMRACTEQLRQVVVDELWVNALFEVRFIVYEERHLFLYSNAIRAQLSHMWKIRSFLGADQWKVFSQYSLTTDLHLKVKWFTKGQSVTDGKCSQQISKVENWFRIAKKELSKFGFVIGFRSVDYHQ